QPAATQPMPASTATVAIPGSSQRRSRYDRDGAARTVSVAEVSRMGVGRGIWVPQKGALPKLKQDTCQLQLVDSQGFPRTGRASGQGRGRPRKRPMRATT